MSTFRQQQIVGSVVVAMLFGTLWQQLVTSVYLGIRTKIAPDYYDAQGPYSENLWVVPGSALRLRLHRDTMGGAHLIKNVRVYRDSLRLEYEGATSSSEYSKIAKERDGSVKRREAGELVLRVQDNPDAYGQLLEGDYHLDFYYPVSEGPYYSYEKVPLKGHFKVRVATREQAALVTSLHDRELLVGIVGGVVGFALVESLFLYLFFHFYPQFLRFQARSAQRQR